MATGANIIHASIPPELLIKILALDKDFDKYFKLELKELHHEFW